jgi:hypothetical protein
MPPDRQSVAKKRKERKALSDRIKSFGYEMSPYTTCMKHGRKCIVLPQDSVAAPNATGGGSNVMLRAFPRATDPRCFKSFRLISIFICEVSWNLRTFGNPVFLDHRDNLSGIIQAKKTGVICPSVQ